jgi:nucleoside diphosphate kinase
MVATDSLTTIISENIKKAQREEIFFEEIYKNSNLPVGKNEFLFFVKPEITVPSKNIQLEKIIDLVQEKIEEFGLNIHNVKILSAKYLEQYNIIAQHYGVINKISSNAVQNMSDSAKEKFKEIYGKSVNEVKVLGGSELLEQYPNFNAYVADYLWQNLENKKLAGGTYCEVIKVDDETIYLINGFHPRQLKHFTEKGRSIAVMTLSGDVSWSDARNNFIGATNPSNANKGSLRREFLDNKAALGLSEVSQGVNGVHLSAGPVEALIELKRYNSNFAEQNGTKDFSEFSFGKILKENFNGEFERIVENSNVNVNGKSISIFDLTEEKNSVEAIDLLKSVI